MKDGTGLNRREFLRGLGATAALTLSLGRLGLRAPGVAAGAEIPIMAEPRYREWEDLYRQEWEWDRVVKGTHLVNCWYQRACAWNIYVKDGIVFREEQVGNYPQTNADVPDFNPRGCQKGACYSRRLYDPGRLRYPLKRVGKRGGGRWKRISWEEALAEIADLSIEVLATDGPGAIVWDPIGGYVSQACGVLDTPALALTAEVGDHHPGALVTCGKTFFSSSADDLFYSDLILIWGGNPVYTQIPNAHFIVEARYNGARVVTIAPDYNASAIHTDEWVPVNVGTDAALGLSMAQVIVEENLHDERFIIEQTDLPLLVRKDTRRLLRGNDLPGGGQQDVFHVFDRTSGRVREAPRLSLALKDIEPALDGEYEVETRDGKVSATPVFALLRERLSAYSPEAASKITGTAATTIRALARQIAGANAATVLTQANSAKFYHAIEIERAQLLVLTLCGQIGKKGSGVMGFPFIQAGGTHGSDDAVLWQQRDGQGRTAEMQFYDRARKGYAGGRALAGTLFFHRHAGLADAYGSAKKFDPWMKREFADFLEDSLSKGWQLVPKTSPRILLAVGGNVLRRARGCDRMIDGFLPKLDLVVSVDWRMNTTALHSDFVLPAAGWYEKNEIAGSTPIAPFVHVLTRATHPLAESKTDWEFMCLYMKALQQRASERGIRTYRDRQGKERHLDKVYDRFTSGRRYTEANHEDYLTWIFSSAGNVGGVTWNQLKEKGFERYTRLGSSLNLGNATDVRPGETITANTWHTEHKLPWPTLTRRLQFYVDHSFYMELGEELPIHKDNPAIGGDYPLQMTGGHTRWSIHASWRDEPHLLQLQRGEPLVVMAQEDADARGIEDGDYARIRNDAGAFEAQIRVSATVRPGQVIAYHAWEPFQFKGHKCQQSVFPSPINPLQVAGGYYHLQPTPFQGEPGPSDRGTRVEIERVLHG